MDNEIALRLLKEHGVEVWSTAPEDDQPIFITFGTFKKLLEAAQKEGQA